MIEFNEDGSIKVPQAMIEQKEKIARKENQKNFLEEFSSNFELDLIAFFKNKKYLGKIESKRNTYHAFIHNDITILLTGIKSKTNINFLLNDEINDLKKFIDSSKFNNFTIYDLMDSTKEYTFSTERLKYYQKDYLKDSSLEGENRRFFYSIILEICYVLAISGHLIIDNNAGRQLVFYKKTNQPNTDRPILKDLEFVKLAENFILLKDPNFYYTLKYKNFRGNIFPYLIEEIEYLHKLI